MIYQEYNAIINSVQVLGHLEIPTCWVQLDLGSFNQSFGGYRLFKDLETDKHNYAGWFLNQLLVVADVNSLDKVPGKCVRVRKLNDSSPIAEIGHIVKDIWMNPTETFTDIKKGNDSTLKEEYRNLKEYKKLQKDMRDLADRSGNDLEGDHYQADELMCEMLKLYGENEFVKLFKSVDKWYA